MGNLNLSGEAPEGNSARNARDGSIALALSLGWPVVATVLLSSSGRGNRTLHAPVGLMTVLVLLATWVLMIRTVSSRAHGGVTRALVAVMLSVFNMALVIILLVAS